MGGDRRGWSWVALATALSYGCGAPSGGAEPPRSPTLAVSPALSGSGDAHDEPAEPSAPAPTPENLQRHAEQLRARLSADGGFQVLVERPFVVIGDQSAAEVERWAEGTIRWAVRHLRRTYFSRDPPRIIEIWLLKDAASYQRQTAALLGREPHTPFGFYSPAEHVLVMNISTGGGTLVHEIVHPFIEANFPRCPPWFNEGLASLYEQCAERDGAICGLTNWRLKGLQQAIVDDELPSFEALCALSRTEFYGGGKGDAYAQARYLCYYLQEEGRLLDYYRRFRDGAGDDPTGYRTLVDVLGATDMAAFEAQWRQFVLKLRFP